IRRDPWTSPFPYPTLFRSGAFGQVTNKPCAGMPAHTFTGIGVYHPSLFRDTAAGTRAPLAPLLRQAMTTNQVIGSRHAGRWIDRSEEHTSELQSRENLVCR